MSRIVVIFALILAGEMVFGLPFHTSRFFRPTLLEVFNFTNTQLGDAFAIFGVAAILTYFPGGALADRFPAHKLMAFSMLSTAAGGVYMATIPGFAGMALLYGYWGITTALLLWGALIKATRDWGGENTQGLAFGLLEGGRGLAAVLGGQIAIFLFASLMPADVVSATDAERAAAFSRVIMLYSAITALIGLFVWFAIPDSPQTVTRGAHPLAGMRTVVKRPIVWAQALVIICAYCGYKGADNYALYANVVLGMTEVQSSQLFVNVMWVRPVTALFAGWVADRFTASRAILIMFILLALSYAVWSLTLPGESGLFIIYANMVLSLVIVFGLRGVYFAMLEENRTPKFLTGAAVGLISVVGYTPDFFFAPIGGRILDAYPGALGHQVYLMFLAGIMVLGVVAVIWLIWLQRLGMRKLWPGQEFSKETAV